MCSFSTSHSTCLLLLLRDIKKSYKFTQFSVFSFSAIPHLHTPTVTVLSYFMNSILSFFVVKFKWHLIIRHQRSRKEKGCRCMGVTNTCMHNWLAHFQCPFLDFQYNNSLPLMLISLSIKIIFFHFSFFYSCDSLKINIYPWNDFTRRHCKFYSNKKLFTSFTLCSIQFTLIFLPCCISFICKANLFFLWFLQHHFS